MFNKFKCYIHSNRYPVLVRKIIHLYNFFQRNNFNKVAAGNNISIGSSILKKCCFRITGVGNEVIVLDFNSLIDCRIIIRGNNNKVYIGNNNRLNETELWIEDDGNRISIGDENVVAGSVQIAVIEGTSVDIGNDCLFSKDISLRTGDSHSILDSPSNERINFSRSIKIGNHVWFGYRAVILKGVGIQNDSVIASSAVVTKMFGEKGIVIGGNPARILRRSISWDAKRLVQEKSKR